MRWRPYCPKLRSRLCHVVALRLIQTAPKNLGSPNPPQPIRNLTPGDRVEGLGNFGKPTGELGTVEQANEDDAVVKWDEDGRMRLRQPWLKKI